MELPSWEPASYAAGLFDGEGHVEDWTPSARSRRLVFTNTDPALIEAYCSCMDELGIAYRVRARKPNALGHPRGTEVVVGRKDAIARFYALVPIQAPKKLERLRRMVA